MKQNLEMTSREQTKCPVKCPICSLTNAQQTVRFERQTMKTNEETLRMSGKNNMILFLIDGAATVRIEEEAFQIRAGQALFFGKNTRLNTLATEPCDLIWLEFSNRIVLGVTDILKRSAYTPAGKQMQNPPMLELKKTLLDRLRNMTLFDSPCYHMILQYELYVLMEYLYTNDEILQFFRPILPANEDFRAFVIDNYLYGDALEDIAGKANMSINNFLRRFKSEFGMTAHQWLVKQKALNLLQTIAAGHKDAKRLAVLFGFNSPAGLYIFCRRQFGKSLKQLMKEAEVGENKIPTNSPLGDFSA